MKNLNFFVLTIKHDKGTHKVGTAATSEEKAKELVCEFEGCPPWAITSVKRRRIVKVA